jgi:hypothetical protein
MIKHVTSQDTQIRRCWVSKPRKLSTDPYWATIITGKFYHRGHHHKRTLSTDPTQGKSRLGTPGR